MKKVHKSEKASRDERPASSLVEYAPHSTGERVESRSRVIREANEATWKQARRQACLAESLIRKRRLACPSTALRPSPFRVISCLFVVTLQWNPLVLCAAPSVVPNNFVINDFVNFRVPSPAQWPRDTLPKLPPSPD
jgi:hypothetical protein